MRVGNWSVCKWWLWISNYTLHKACIMLHISQQMLALHAQYWWDSTTTFFSKRTKNQDAYAYICIWSWIVLVLDLYIDQSFGCSLVASFHECKMLCTIVFLPTFIYFFSFSIFIYTIPLFLNVLVVSQFLFGRGLHIRPSDMIIWSDDQTAYSSINNN